MALPAHKTKIVATIGPASQSQEVIERMIRAGLSVVRLNFSHSDFGAHERAIAAVRAAAHATGQRVAIMADLSGPKMRIGNFASEPAALSPGDRFTLTTNDVVGDRERVSVTFEPLPRVVKRGELLFLDDGNVQLEVAEVLGSDVVCTVRVGGDLRSRKGLNLPGIDLGISAFTERDRECLSFALRHGAEIISQSFVESAADVSAVRRAAGDLGRNPFVVAKIERAPAVERIDEILAAADGIMVARGDLGIELPIEKIAVVQKDIVRRANRQAKPVITATQMLESMTTHRLPTRAEATDVANAIIDGTDAVMLSGESAVGRYPVEAVAMLARIAATAEPTRARSAGHTASVRDGDAAELIARAVEACFARATPAAVFVPTLSGATARRMAALRLPVWVVAVSASEKTCQELQLVYGVVAEHEPEPPAAWDDYVRSWVRERSLPGRFVLRTEGPSALRPHANHRLEIVEL